MDKTRLTVVLMGTAAKRPGEALQRRQGKKIKDFRTMPRPGLPKGYSQSYLATAVGVTKAAVSEWENGKSTPRPHHQVRIAKALGSPWSALFGLDGEAA